MRNRSKSKDAHENRNRKFKNKTTKITKKPRIQLNSREDLVNKFQNEAVDTNLDDKQPVWVDEDDEIYGANIIPNVHSKEKYSHKLKQKFETLVGKPQWAKIKPVDPENDDDEIVRTVGHLHKKKRGPESTLAPGLLNFHYAGPINFHTKNEGPVISCLEFHPKSSVVLVAGQSGIITLFEANSYEKNKLHSFKLAKWKNKLSSVHFTPDGNEAYISSKTCNNFYVYDLINAQTKLYNLPTNLKRSSVFKMSPDGRFIAAADGFDEVYLICAKSKELLRCIKHNSNVKSIVFSPDSAHLYSYLDIGSVTIWDLSTYRSIITFTDQGCVKASCIEVSQCGKLLATGSGEGIVNVYKTSSLNTSYPEPLKVINNLRTKITSLRFNPTSEIIAMASSVLPNAVKLAHIPTYNIYMNFPKQRAEINHVHSLNFSPHSGYLGLGDNMSLANLYRLKFYQNY